MRAIIIAAGTISNYSYIKSLIKETDYIICADNGYKHASMMELKIEILIGDFDSIEASPENVKSIKFPAKKDSTDTELAVKHAIETGHNELILFGACGTRLDHTLANIQLLKPLCDANIFAQIIDEHNKIMIIKNSVTLNEPIGTTVSLIPFSTCKGVTTNGLEYVLTNATLEMGNSFGVSNIITNTNAKITVKQGYLIIIIAQD